MSYVIGQGLHVLDNCLLVYSFYITLVINASQLSRSWLFKSLVF